ncbi:S1 RNA-binding domain-containing protein [Neptunicella sp. SCSIO 80796]|uniref:CvfB family protein n=1 Tax=Neptunicella plasticusilytica TaxID=3117012 RepID=UPI003A4DEE4B
MLQIGKTNHLKITDTLPYGVYLSDEQQNQVLMPNAHLPANAKQGDWLDVFVYHDADGQLVATSTQAKGELGQCVYLNVVGVKPIGAFLDWGLDKDLFVPRNEQESIMQEGRSYVVYIYQDRQTGRIAASSKLHNYLHEESLDFQPRQKVELLISARTDLGYKAVINGTHLGLLFKDEVFKPVYIGQTLPGYIKNIREDGKIDLCFQFTDQAARSDLTSQIIAHLQQNNGVSELTDKSDAKAIYKQFNVSKNAYKKALGALYKQQRIQLGKTQISLIK